MILPSNYESLKLQASFILGLYETVSVVDKNIFDALMPMKDYVLYMLKFKYRLVELLKNRK